MTHFIRTIEEFRAIKDSLEPVFIHSKKHGKIPVPCANTLLIARDLIVANDYNPNIVPDHRMRMLAASIRENGWLFPIVCIYDDENNRFVIIDGFHRDSTGDKKYLDLDYIPTVVLTKSMADRMLLTMNLNKLKGFHQVDLDANVIRRLIEQGLGDEEIANSLGIETDTVARYKSLTGIAALFANTEYSPAWEYGDEEEGDAA